MRYLNLLLAINLIYLNAFTILISGVVDDFLIIMSLVYLESYFYLKNKILN